MTRLAVLTAVALTIRQATPPDRFPRRSTSWSSCSRRDHGRLDELQRRRNHEADQLSRAQRSWYAYAEGYPACAHFAKKHVPFLYFRGGASHFLSLSRFDVHDLPAYAFVVPDLCHDMHDCPVATVRPGSSFAARIDHYGLLRTTEGFFGLKPLGSASTARPIAGIWR